MRTMATLSPMIAVPPMARTGTSLSEYGILSSASQELTSSTSDELSKRCRAMFSPADPAPAAAAARL